jgi:hypothetical protein
MVLVTIRRKAVPESAVGETSEGRGAGRSGGFMGPVYGLGVVGAAVYFIQHASGFGEGVLGFLKALVWPAVLVYKLLEFIAA